MSRPRTGGIIERAGKIYARVQYTNKEGKRRAWERRAQTRSEAREMILHFLSTLPGGHLSVSGSTFSEVAKAYIDDRVQPPIYQGERKVEGMRSWKGARREVKLLIEYFGRTPIKEITYQKIAEYKSRLYKKETVSGEKRTAYSVNHQLRRLRAILNYAVQGQIITANPFHHGEPLISAADEIPRSREKGETEPERLLAECTGPREHLRLAVILALDTAMRLGEILSLEKADVDLSSGIITIRAFNTKTATRRQVPISARLREELERVLPAIEYPDGRLFGGAKSIRTAWRTACYKAGLEDLHFHDLRHWSTTDIVEAVTGAGIPLAHAMKITGHTQEKTFRRYIRTDEEITKAAGLALEKLRARPRLLRRKK